MLVTLAVVAVAAVTAIATATALTLVGCAASTVADSDGATNADDGSGVDGIDAAGRADASTCTPPSGPPIIDPQTLPACPGCSGGHCLAAALVAENLAADLRACDGLTLCVPDELIASAGRAVPKSCVSLGGAEGRCLSTCLPEIAAHATDLPVSTCAPTHRCAPCFDPLDGHDTGACRLTCDPGPASDAGPPARCCEDRGRCLVPELAGERAASLGADTCPASTPARVCVPDVFIAPGGYAPAPCQTVLLAWLLGDAYKEGRCYPGCLPALQNGLIGQDGCAPGMKCAPCKDPQTGAASGACSP